MNNYMLFKRMTALAFVFLILGGNYWFVLFVTGQSAPAWLDLGFHGIAAIVFIGFIGMTFSAKAPGADEPPEDQ